eukprot:CAMPEP_0206517176 /NCGR_PEP_ID=MMETSP0324_2-20121206/63814_1 /ASSEMBLY_ACC=CAM_ASM_000836 /TAXON_ID=2866 /ORGANISM="Crypthecodinium cohnii, Strain Seligo" /LENGTH=172 /DNA_ID=CAMNT_0054010265 /DNA_START=280 /DNA_END=799 /DNA_ORIENTATION=+
MIGSEQCMHFVASPASNLSTHSEWTFPRPPSLFDLYSTNFPEKRPSTATPTGCEQARQGAAAADQENEWNKVGTALASISVGASDGKFVCRRAFLSFQSTEMRRPDGDVPPLKRKAVTRPAGSLQVRTLAPQSANKSVPALDAQAALYATALISSTFVPLLGKGFTVASKSL